MATILMYSYKGGSGRTTITAHVACKLAQMGKKVLCIDLDVHGPGLRLVFDIKNHSENCFLQDYIMHSKEFDLVRAVKDMQEYPDCQSYLKGQGSLYVLPASQDYNKQLQKLDYERISENLQALVKEIVSEKITSPDILLIDSASGYNEISKAGFYLADHVIMFYKYSKQHLIGTISMIKFFEQQGFPYSLVASAVPPTLSDEQHREARDAYDQYLRDHITRDEGEEKIIAWIKEEERLKWNESILYFDPIVDKYTDFFDAIKNISKKIASI